MKVIVNRFIPLHGYVAMVFYNYIFWRKEYEYKIQDIDYYNVVINHESIHNAQMKRICKNIFIGGTLFYILYAFEWIKNIFKYGFSKAYKNISYEIEAYNNEKNLNYLNND